MLIVSGILQLLTGCQLLSSDVTLIKWAETKLMQQNDLSRQETNSSLFRELAPTVLQRSDTRQTAAMCQRSQLSLSSQVNVHLGENHDDEN